MPTFAPQDLKRARELIDLEVGLQALRLQRPWEWYQPHAKQLAFHKARQRVRALYPGNRFGKTSAAAMEALWFATGTHPYWPTRKSPGDVIWSCPGFAQFKILLPKLRALIWGPLPKWRESDNCLEFPGGGRVWAWSRERDWTTLKGISPRAIIFDEDALEALWNESKTRGYGEDEMSTIITTTPTEAMGTFMETDVYQPWLEYHQERGQTEEEANTRQLHPRIFCITRGGIADNPALAHRVEEFRAEKFTGGTAEWEVRNHGGFRFIGTTGVFDADTLRRVAEEQDALNERAGKGLTGYLRPDDRKVAGLRGLAGLKLEAIKDKRFIFEPEAPGEHGRLTVWEKPRLGRQYTMGFDAAYGLEDGDWDSLSIVDITANPAREVASAHGHWGNRLVRIVYALACWYNHAFIMGERQVGLFTLKTLDDELEYTNLYRQRDMANRLRKPTDKLGWHRAGNDITLQTLKDALDDGGLILRDPEALREMQRLVWERPDSTAVGHKRDSKVRGVMLRGGGSPDRTIARCYAIQAKDEIYKAPKTDKPRRPKDWKWNEAPEDALHEKPEKDALDELLE